MSTAVAKIIAYTVIMVALLATIVALVRFGAPIEVTIGVSALLGTAGAGLIPMLTGKGDSSKGGGAAAVLLGVVASLVGESGCSSPPPALNVENAAAVAQYEMLLLDCRNLGKAKNSYDAYEACADRVDADLCASSGLRCKDGGQ